VHDSGRAPASLDFSSNPFAVMPDTEILRPSGKTYVGVSHDQESERRLSGVVVERTKHGRAIQDERRGAEAAAAGGVFQAAQRLLIRACASASVIWAHGFIALCTWMSKRWGKLNGLPHRGSSVTARGVGMEPAIRRADVTVV
jgi:hypothetical protein